MEKDPSTALSYRLEMVARNLPSLVSFFLGAASSLTAQSPRISVTPTAGWIWPTSIFEHATTAPSPTGGAALVDHQRLWVHSSQIFGGRLDIALGRGWGVFASGGGTPRTRVDFVDSASTVVSRWWDKATIKTWNGGVSKDFRIPGGLPELRTTVGAGTYRFALNRSQSCLAPLLCTTPPPWVGHYNVTSFVGGLEIRKRIAGHFALELSGTESVGRANTENFFVDFIPPFDYLEAPKSYRVRTTQATLGISIF